MGEVKRRQRIRRKTTDQPITDSDWESIFARTWKEDETELLKALRENANKAMSVRDIGPWVVQRLNYRLLQAGFDFRIDVLEKYSRDRSWDRGHIKLFHTVNMG
jgi:hypothetical protein